MIYKKMIKFSEPVIDNKEINSVTKTLKSGWISSQGSIVETFEKNFQEFIIIFIHYLLQIVLPHYTWH